MEELNNNGTVEINAIETLENTEAVEETEGLAAKTTGITGAAVLTTIGIAFAAGIVSTLGQYAGVLIAGKVSELNKRRKARKLAKELAKKDTEANSESEDETQEEE